MIESFKNCLAFYVIATRAILVSGVAVFGTGSILAFNVNKVVTVSLNNYLTFNVIATRAILVSGVAVFSTGSILAFNVNKIVTVSLNNFLAFNVIATRAILVCGITVFGTSRILAFNVNEIVTESRNYYFSAKQAILRCCTGCISALEMVNSCVNLVAIIPVHGVDYAISALVKFNIGSLVAVA